MMSMCPGAGCPLAERCERHYRYRHKADYPFAGVYPREPWHEVRQQYNVNGQWTVPKASIECADHIPKEQGH